MRLIEERAVVGNAHRVTRDREDVDVLGSRWVAKQRVAGGHDDDVGLNHAGTLQNGRAASVPYRPSAPPFGVASARGSTPSGDAFTPTADGERALLCDLLVMNTYPAIWSARLVPPSINALTVTPVNVMVRVVYNTLDGIVNDYFVITASVSSR